MNFEWLPIRYGIMALVVVLACQQLFFTLLPPKERLISNPPYSPVDVQRFNQWIHPNELMMSDLPWAVAWYADRPAYGPRSMPGRSSFSLTTISNT